MKFLDSFLGRFGKDVGVDLGTSNTLVYVKERGIVIDQPSVVAVNKKTGQLLAIGREAKKMIGKTPSHITAIKPLRSGVISDFDVTEQMLRYFFKEIQEERSYLLPRPRVVIGIPSGITEVEKKAVEEAALNAGAREVYLIEEPMAACIGARLPIFEALGNMVVDIGGGTTEIAIISLGGMVTFKSLRMAGDKFNDDIIQSVRENSNVLLGERSAEKAKIEVGSAVKEAEKKEISVRGRDLVTGLPKEIKLTSEEVRKALEKSINNLISNIKETIEETPPELISDVMKRGIILTGGGSMLSGLDELISTETGISVRITEDPLTTVVRGTGIVLEEIDKFKDVVVNVENKTTPEE